MRRYVGTIGGCCDKSELRQQSIKMINLEYECHYGELAEKTV